MGMEQQALSGHQELVQVLLLRGRYRIRQGPRQLFGPALTARR
jgi:hypothetical protein